MWAVQLPIMRFTFLFALLALAAGCASTPSSPPSMTSATVDTSAPSFTPNADGFVMVETPNAADEAAPKSAAPVAMPVPNHEQPRGHVHAATN